MALDGCAREQDGDAARVVGLGIAVVGRQGVVVHGSATMPCSVGSKQIGDVGAAGIGAWGPPA